jgi:hypothetical protein
MVSSFYCVWYKDASVNKETCVGACSTWDEARSLAGRLYTVKKKIDDSENLSTGIFLFSPGELYTARSPKRWQIMPLLTSNTQP